MFKKTSKRTSLRAQLAKALQTDRLHEALDLYEQIEKQAPDEPRWSHRKGDLLQRMGRKADAVLAYERAVDLYAEKGFVARAAAMAKLIIAMEPSKGDVLERVDPRAARELHRRSRAVIVTAEDTPTDSYQSPPTDTQSLITDALPLVPDRRAPREETRFTNPEKTEDVTIDFTDVELLEPAPPAEPLVSQRPTAAALAQLPSMPLFAEVPRDLLIALMRGSELVDLPDGQRLTTLGNSADALYVLVEGNAVGHRSSGAQDLLLGEGDIAGVACLLSNVSYSEDVIACGRVRALRIGKPLLDTLVGEHPAFGDVLLEVLSRRLIATLLRSSPIFTGFDERTRTNLARLFQVRRARAGTRLLEAGKRSDGMYLPLHGDLIVRAKNGRRVGKMEMGLPLGQDSLLTREPARFTVEAISDVLVLRMPLELFGKLLMQRPDIVQRFQGHARGLRTR
jgi:CRP-like cAMP-binding protein